MGSVWGTNLKISVFGESHGIGVGIVVDNFPCGIKLDYNYINDFLKRRAPGGPLSTDRAESDIPEIYSGVLNNYTTGAPICMMIKNNNQRSTDYAAELVLPRPSHADLNAHIKYKGFADLRGGGHFSGRLTAPLVFAGALCMLYLKEQYDIEIHSNFEYSDEYIAQLKNEGNSIGARIETTILNMPQSVGSNIFSTVESSLASIMFAIPGVKAVEFGRGTEFAVLTGNEANDEYYYDKDGSIKTKTNNNGGILGGISTGMPIVFVVTVKPTPSIFTEQNTVNLKEKKNDKIKITGRHDPCIGIRACPVIEACAAISITDLLLGERNI